MNPTLIEMLSAIEPKGEFTKMIHFGLRNGHQNEVVEILQKQSIDAPNALKKIIGEQAFELIRNQAA